MSTHHHIHMPPSLIKGHHPSQRFESSHLVEEFYYLLEALQWVEEKLVVQQDHEMAKICLVMMGLDVDFTDISSYHTYPYTSHNEDMDWKEYMGTKDYVRQVFNFSQTILENLPSTSSLTQL